MPSSKSRNSSSTSRGRAPGSPATRTRTRPAHKPTKSSQYVRGLSTRERVDMVLHELNEKHRWSIKDLVYHMVTAKPIKKNGVSCLVQAKALSDGLYQQEEVVEQLLRASQDIRTVGNSALVDRIRTELRSVTSEQARCWSRGMLPSWSQRTRLFSVSVV